MSVGLLVLVVGLALALAYVNGFHDASNAVSTAIATRSLRESTALAMAALLNLLGALLALLILALTTTWALRLLGLTEMAAATAGDPDLLAFALIAIALSTLAWEVGTWWYGMPSSTWHAFYGGVAGAYLALGKGGSVDRIAALVLIPTLLGPVLSVALSYLAMRALMAIGRTERLRTGHIRFAQTVSAGAVATGHGMNDVRLPMAVAMVAAASAGLEPASTMFLGVPIAVAVAAGTLMGGHRIIRTIGRRMTDLSAAQGLAAESSAVLVIAALAAGIHAPISTSHTLASGVVGAGLARGPRHIKWNVVRSVVLTWLLTPFGTGLMSLAMVIVVISLR